MEYVKNRVKIQGVAPLIVHNPQLADPLNSYTRALKEISSKRKKTDADHEAMSKIQFVGSLYFNEKQEFIVPGVNLEKIINDGAKLTKQGKEVIAGVLVEDDPVINFKGPKTTEELYKDKRFILRAPVVINSNRVMSTRPQFPEWSLEFDISYLPDVINWKSISEAIINAGRLKGLGDWRPRFGRFLVV